MLRMRRTGRPLSIYYSNPRQELEHETKKDFSSVIADMQDESFPLYSATNLLGFGSAKANPLGEHFVMSSLSNLAKLAT